MHKKVDRDAKRREEKRQESLSIGGESKFKGKRDPKAEAR